MKCSASSDCQIYIEPTIFVVGWEHGGLFRSKKAYERPRRIERAMEPERMRKLRLACSERARSAFPRHSRLRQPMNWFSSLSTVVVAALLRAFGISPSCARMGPSDRHARFPPPRSVHGVRLPRYAGRPKADRSEHERRRRLSECPVSQRAACLLP